MSENWDFSRCIDVLKNEISVIKGISGIHDKVRHAVINREWTEFDEKMQEINVLGNEFMVFEEERIKLFSSLTQKNISNDKNKDSGELLGEEDVPFYVLIMNLPDEQRKELSYQYRELKMEVYKMRAINETVLAYLGEAKNLASAYIEAVCPARGGKLYTKNGIRVSQDLKSMVLNDHY